MTELAQIAQYVGASDRSLRRAVDLGTIRGERISPRVLGLTRTEATYVRRHWQMISSLRRAFRTEPNTRFALLFGSAARGDMSEDSDVDLIVSLRDSSLERLADLSLKLEGATGHSVDVVDMKTTEADPTFLVTAMDEGRVLIDRDDIWRPLSARRGHLRAKGRNIDAANRKLTNEQMLAKAGET